MEGEGGDMGRGGRCADGSSHNNLHAMVAVARQDDAPVAAERATTPVLALLIASGTGQGNPETRRIEVCTACTRGVKSKERKKQSKLCDHGQQTIVVAAERATTPVLALLIASGTGQGNPETRRIEVCTACTRGVKSKERKKPSKQKRARTLQEAHDRR